MVAGCVAGHRYREITFSLTHWLRVVSIGQLQKITHAKHWPLAILVESCIR